MKRSRVDSTSSEESSVYSEKSSSELDIFDDDEIEEVMQDLSQSTIPKDKALAFLHSLAASKSILYWNSHGEMTYHQRRIPLTNIVELIEYAMLSYNLDVRTPRGLKTFTNGLSEVGIDKTLIRNKRLLADLVARQPEEEDTDDESESGEEETDESEAESTSTESDSGKSESSESDDEPRECHVCRDFTPFYSIPIVQCPRCLWREGYYCRQNQHVECDVCAHVFPVNVKTTKTKFCRCRDCDAVHELSLKFNKLKLIDGEQESEED
ncbi:hypothetical protein QZH41_006925 [Actinostola sp. cb2023]|nr:hypothetical protein QZH41_006925 [Actinostola sp. cb2023]